MNKFIILTIICFSLIENKIFSMFPPHLRKKQITDSTYTSQNTKNIQSPKNDAEYPIHLQLFFKNPQTGNTICLETNFKKDGTLPIENLKKQLATKIDCNWENIILLDCGKIINKKYITKKEFMERGNTYFLIKKDNK